MEDQANTALAETRKAHAAFDAAEAILNKVQSKKPADELALATAQRDIADAADASDKAADKSLEATRLTIHAARTDAEIARCDNLHKEAGTEFDIAENL